MGRPQPVSARRRSIAHQAALRLIFSLALFVVLLGFSSYKLYSVALQKSAHERAGDLATFYRTRLMQLDRDWELQARDFKVRLEIARLLEDKKTGIINLQAFMTLQGTNRRFQYLLIQDRIGGKIFEFGTDLDLKSIPIPIGRDDGWYFALENGNLYRVFVVPIWLGETGTGRMAIFYQIDNSLLFNLATPDIMLIAKHNGKPIASSAGQAGVESAKLLSTRAAEVEEREISWSGNAADQTVLCIVAPIKVLFTKTELVVGAATIPIIDGLILWFTLGFWLMRNARRIRELGGAVEEFSIQQRPTAALDQKLDMASGEQIDEISEVAGAIEDMAEQTLQRERERQREEAQHHLWSMVFANSHEAVVITDRDNNILTVNAAFTHLTGYAEDEAIGRNPRILSSGRETPEFYTAMWQQLEEQGSWSGELQDRRKDGSLYPKWLSISVVRDSDGNVTNYVGTFLDITERKQNEEQLIYLASHDALTGLPNRHLLLDRLQSAVSLSHRSNEVIGLLFLDLDNFKWVNDSLGHASGDKLLMAVATRLKDTVRVSDTVARLGGDEFVVLLTQAASDLEIAQIASKIIDAIARPLDLSGHDFHVTTSMGISTFPNDGEDATTLLKHADTAMYTAKAAGKNQYRYFDPAMNRSAVERIELEQDLRQALNRGEFELYYQPKLCVARNSICGAEALIRWRHPRLGIVAPAKFIPLAEETSLIIEIGEWVIHSACRQTVAWQEEGILLRGVAVNLSAIQLESDSFVDSVKRILEETGASTDAIEFELTESMVLRNPERSVVTLNRLRQLGIRLALDDFGTGYSSLSYLKRLPIDTLKIDRSFIEGLPEEADDAQIVRMIIALAKSVRLEVVAEGIETSAQRDLLTELSCEFLQGYLISKPLPAEEFRALLIVPGCAGCGLPKRCDSPTDWSNSEESKTK
ncbi:MAG: EAL domain-containing protein [Betaproteobacteria bacterium]|nr:EAL domain-containing protein [Betaproteobacteria bacterium]